MTTASFLSDELINERLLEEISVNVQEGFEVVVDKRGYRSVAARVYIALADVWGMNESEAAELLGISENNFLAWKEGDTESLSTDCMEKISCLIGIYKYLCVLYSGHKDRVKVWLQRDNYGEHFGGHTPYELLVQRDTSEFHSIRRVLASYTV